MTPSPSSRPATASPSNALIARRGFGSTAGLAIVELLLAGAIAVIVLGFASNYFLQQSIISRRMQAKHEVELKAKSVSELILQDLQMAGSRVVINDGVASSPNLPCSASRALKCVSSPSGGEGAQDDLTVYYATSLRPAEPCRRIDYDLNGGTLWRSELKGSLQDCGQLPALPAAFSGSELAGNIAELDIDFICADAALATTGDPSDCYAGGSFPRTVEVRVVARSETHAGMTATVELSGSMPNLRY